MKLQEAYAVLGIAPEASRAEAKRGYLRKVKAHPPERDPEAFKQVREAWELVLAAPDVAPRRTLGDDEGGAKDEDAGTVGEGEGPSIALRSAPAPNDGGGGSDELLATIAACESEVAALGEHAPTALVADVWRRAVDAHPGAHVFRARLIAVLRGHHQLKAEVPAQLRLGWQAGDAACLGHLLELFPAECTEDELEVALQQRTLGLVFVAARAVAVRGEAPRAAELILTELEAGAPSVDLASCIGVLLRLEHAGDDERAAQVETRFREWVAAVRAERMLVLPQFAFYWSVLNDLWATRLLVPVEIRAAFARAALDPRAVDPVAVALRHVSEVLKRQGTYPLEPIRDVAPGIASVLEAASARIVESTTVPERRAFTAKAMRQSMARDTLGIVFVLFALLPLIRACEDLWR